MTTLIEYIEIHNQKKVNQAVSNTLLSPHIVGIQPMTSPVGLIYTMKPKYSSGWTKMLHNANYDRAMKGVV